MYWRRTKDQSVQDESVVTHECVSHVGQVFGIIYSKVVVTLDVETWRHEFKEKQS